MKTIKYILIAALTAAGNAAAFELPAMNADSLKAAAAGNRLPEASAQAVKGYPGEQDQAKVWLPFRQEAQDWWTTSESDPFAQDRIEVNVRKSGFMDDFEVDFSAGHGREMGTIRYFASRFELSAMGTEVNAEKWLDSYRLEGRVRLDNGRSVRISLEMKKEFNNENYVIASTGLLLNVNRFGITGEAPNTIGYPKKVLAVIAAMSMAIFQTPQGGF